MPEKFPNPNQMNINRKGGLYDQATQINIERDGGLYDEAREEDAQREQMRRDLPNYISDQILGEGVRRHQPVEEERALNEMLAKYFQDEAYASYARNIQTPPEAPSQPKRTESIDDKEIRKKLRRAKVRRVLGNIAAGALLIPGIDVMADFVQEEVTSANLNKQRRAGYKSRNGTLFGNPRKGYVSTLDRAYEKHRNQFNNKNDVEIYQLEELLKNKERERASR